MVAACHPPCRSAKVRRGPLVSLHVTVALRIVSAVLVLGAVVIGVVVVVNALGITDDLRYSCKLPGQDDPSPVGPLRPDCSTVPQYQAKAVAAGAMGLFSISLAVGAVALRPGRTGERRTPAQPAAPAVAWAGPPAPPGQQPGGTYGPPTRG